MFQSSRLRNASSLRGDYLPAPPLVYIHVDASKLTADVMTLPFAFQSRVTRHNRRIAINTHLNLSDAERLQLTKARLHLTEALGLVLYYAQWICKSVVIGPDAVQSNGIVLLMAGVVITGASLFLGQSKIGEAASSDISPTARRQR